MKITRFFIVLLLLVSLVCFVFVSCQKKPEKSLEFELNADKKSYSVTGFKSSFDRTQYCDLVIPAKHKGKPVTRIAYSAFLGVPGLRSVVIPESVTEIDSYAFQKCSNLRSISFQGKNCLETIGDFAFAQCSIMGSFVIPASVTHVGLGIFVDSYVTIYCEVESQPEGWSVYWNAYSSTRACPTVWGYSKE